MNTMYKMELSEVDAYAIALALDGFLDRHRNSSFYVHLARMGNKLRDYAIENMDEDELISVEEALFYGTEEEDV